MGRRDPAQRDTKQRLLDAGLAVFSERGYHAATIDEIAARAECTKGAVYYYFRDKDDLARDIQARLWDRLTERALSAIDPSADVIETMMNAFRAYLDALEGLGIARFFLRDVWAVSGMTDRSNEQHERGIALVRGLLEEGVRRGELADVDVDAGARILVGAFNEATLHVLTTGSADATVEVLRRVLSSFAASRPRARARSAR